jgi:hypothetical protein
MLVVKNLDNPTGVFYLVHVVIKVFRNVYFWFILGDLWTLSSLSAGKKI